LPDRVAVPPSLCITLLGRVALRTRTGTDVRLSGRHAYALLTILALTLRPRTREAIAADLWPDTAVAATGPLRQALYQLRAALLAAGLDPEAILESGGNDPTRAELAGFINALNDDEQAHLVALVWIGRGTFEPEELDEAVETAKAERVTATSRYLLGIPLLADYLEEGLERLGYSVEDVENDVM